MTFLLGLILGLIVGGIFGVMLMALCISRKIIHIKAMTNSDFPQRGARDNAKRTMSIVPLHKLRCFDL